MIDTRPRIAALIVGLGLVVTAAVMRQEASDPEDHDEGESAAEAAAYAADQDQAERPPQWEAIDAHNEARRGPLQPIPFNHRFHATDLQVPCMYCHAGTERSVSGVVPSVDICMGCHQIAGTGLPPVEQLRELARNGETIEWEWVNKLPEFVQFSHRPHLRNNLACAECHGPVEQMDRVYQWAPFTMGWCLECHRQPPQTSDVSTDYVLSQLNRPPDIPSERQELSFYPRAINSNYGATRAPTDCAACHH